MTYPFSLRERVRVRASLALERSNAAALACLLWAKGICHTPSFRSTRNGLPVVRRASCDCPTNLCQRERHESVSKHTSAVLDEGHVNFANFLATPLAPQGLPGSNVSMEKLSSSAAAFAPSVTLQQCISNQWRHNWLRSSFIDSLFGNIRSDKLNH